MCNPQLSVLSLCSHCFLVSSLSCNGGSKCRAQNRGAASVLREQEVRGSKSDLLLKQRTERWGEEWNCSEVGILYKTVEFMMTWRVLGCVDGLWNVREWWEKVGSVLRLGGFSGRYLLCFLTLDFVTVKYFHVVYVASRHFIILYIFVRQINDPVLIKGNNLKRCTYILNE